MKRGKYIIFESGEGGGKTTHAKFCEDYLKEKGINATYFREPGSVEIAEDIRRILLKKGKNIDSFIELCLFEGARRAFFKEVVKPKLEEGVSIVSDRSMYSTLTYQGYGGGVDSNLIEALNKTSTFGIKPDLVVLINIDPKKGLEKELNPDRIGAKGLEFHTRVNQGYLKIADENSEIFEVIPYIENGLEEMQRLYLPRINELFGL